MNHLKAQPSNENDYRLQAAACAGGDPRHRMLAMQDAMAVLGGKWKIQLIGALAFSGKRRFSELLRDVEGIGPKMLSKELHDLETNQLITRTVLQTKPITVEYAMTEYGGSLCSVINEIVTWGVAHRERIMKGHLVVAHVKDEPAIAE
jgi:DNA-binding HxlR family transcriptional regulator